MMIWGSLAVLMGGLSVPTTAQEQIAAEETSVEEKVVTVPEMLEQVEYVTKVKPKKKAFVYFFLRSHSNCGFCVAMSGANNEAYKEMKGKGAELIMLNCDPSTEKALAWAKKSDLSFPIITPETKDAVKVPSGGGAYPNMVVVTSDGEVLKDGSFLGMNACKGALAGWKEYVKEAKKMNREKRKEAEKAKAGKKKAKKKKKAAAEEEPTELPL